MRESELLALISERSKMLVGDRKVVVGPGDDCAVVRVGRGGLLCIGVDQLIEGRHFEAGTAIDLIARKAVARAVSDVAAMGGTPTWGLATAALPKGYEHGSELFDAMHDWGNRFGCPLVGGDIAATDGPLVLTVTAAGTLHKQRGAVLRSDARIGDGVYVTGKLGGSFKSGRHLTFEPRVGEAGELCDVLGDRLGAMIDVSDGLGMDAHRVGVASGVEIELEAGLLPCHDGVSWEGALGDGEDYELVFTASGEVPDSCCDTAVTRIGRVVKGMPGASIKRPDGVVIGCSGAGWEHGDT